MSITTVRYRGMIRLGSHGEGDDILFLTDDDDAPLAGRVMDDIDEHGRYLSVRYWTAYAEQPDDAMIEGALRALLGEGCADFGHHYSEITGYLWTDEKLDVGGHDLLTELESQAGRYCLLEVGYSKEPLPVRELAMSVRRGSRESLTAALDNIAGGCLGSDRLRAEARDAAEALRRGAGSATAGHVRYEVTGG